MRKVLEIIFRGVTRGGCKSAALVMAILILCWAGAVNAQNSQFIFDGSGALLSGVGESTAVPQILAQPQQQIVLPGKLASFSPLLTDTRGVSYQWLFNGALIAGATQDTLGIDNASTNNEGNYAVIISNASGSITSALAALFIDADADGLPDSWEIAHFGNTTQTALGDADGDGVSNLQEFFDGTDPTNSASALYQIALINDGGAVTTSPNVIKFPKGQVVSLTATASGSSAFRAWTGDVVSRSNSISLTMTNNKTLFAHFKPISFRWTNNVNGDWNGASNWSPNLTPGSGDSVVVNQAATITLNTNFDVTDFTFGNPNVAPELTGSGVLTIHGRASWQAGMLTGSGRTVVAPGATMDVGGGLTLTMNSRTLDNQGTVLWSSANMFISGSIITNEPGAVFQVRGPVTFSGGGTTHFDNNGTLRIAGSGNVSFSSFGLNNFGSLDINGANLNWSGGGIHAGPVTLSNGGVLNFGGGNITSSNSPSITGQGSLVVSGANAILGGVINVAGSNVFNTGSVEINGNYTCTNNTLAINSANVNFDGTGNISPALVTVAGGTLGGSNTVTVSGVMNWSGGTMSGGGRTIILPNATLNLGGGVAPSLNNRILDNRGKVIWFSGNLFVGSSTITNEPGSLFQIQNSITLGSLGGSSRFDNLGTLQFLGTGNTMFNGPTLNNFNVIDLQNGTLSLVSGGIHGGTITVPAGATLNFAGGTFTSSGNPLITGAGVLQVSGGINTLAGTINVTGSNIFSGGSVEFTGAYNYAGNVLTVSGGTVNFDGTSTVTPAIVNLSSGAMGGSNSITVGNAMNWTGGMMSGFGRTIILPSATLTLASTISPTLANRTLDNQGTVLWTAGNLFMNFSVVTNEPGATFQIQSPASLFSGGGTPRFDNAGLFRIIGSTNTSFSGPSLNNFSEVDLLGGTLNVGGGGMNAGVITVAGGATLNFSAGVFTTAGNPSLTGAGVLVVNGGTITLGGLVNVAGSNTFSSGSAEINGNYIATNNTMTVSGGTVNFDGIGPVNPALLNLSAGSLGGSNTVTVGNVMNWNGGLMTGNGRTVIAPTATLNMGGPIVSSLNFRTLENRGTILWPTGNVSMASGIITNGAGALFLIQGTGTISGSGIFNNAGTVRITSSGTTAFTGPVFTNLNVLDLKSGIIAISSGYFSSSNATLNSTFSGTVPGTNYGQLKPSGPFTLNGTLGISFAGNYVPTTNDSFFVVTNGVRSGAFANFIYPSNKVSLSLSNTASAVIVRVTDVSNLPAPVLLSLQLSSTNITLVWNAVSNTSYRVEYNPDLNPADWQALMGDVMATNTIASKTDVTTPSNRLYRIRVLP